MASYDETQNLILNVTGRDQVESLRKAIVEWEAAFASASKTYGHYSREAKDAASTLTSLNQQLREQERLAKSTETSTRGMGSGILYASYALQDFTSAGGDFNRGLMSIQNNIPQILLGLGAGAGLTGVVSALSIGVGAALPHVVEYGKQLGLWGENATAARDAISKLEEKVKELEKKPIKLSADLDAIDAANKTLTELKANLAQLEANQRAKNSYQKESGAAVRETLLEDSEGLPSITNAIQSQITSEKNKLATGPGGEITKAKADEAAARKRLEEIVKALDTATGDEAATLTAEYASTEALIATAVEAQKAARRKVNKDAQDEAGAIFRGAFEGKDEQRIELARRLRKSGRRALAEGVEASSPENLKATEQAEYDAEQSIERQREGRIRQTRKTDRAARTALETLLGSDDGVDQVAQALAETMRKRGPQNMGLTPEQQHQTARNLAREALQKGTGIRDRAAKALGDIQAANGGLVNGVWRAAPTEREQFELMREITRAEIQKYLEDEGIDTRRLRTTINATAGQVAGGARSRLAELIRGAKGTAEDVQNKAKGANRGRIGEQIEREDEAAQAGGYNDFAMALLRQGMVAGGFHDRFGRFRRMSGEQINDYVMGQLQRSFHRQTGVDRNGRPVFANPGMGEEETWSNASRVFARAQEQLRQEGLEMRAAANGVQDRQVRRRPVRNGLRSVPPTSAAELAAPAQAEAASMAQSAKVIAQATGQMAGMMAQLAKTVQGQAVGVQRALTQQQRQGFGYGGANW